jgi:hypothetical protein
MCVHELFLHIITVFTETPVPAFDKATHATTEDVCVQPPLTKGGPRGEMSNAGINVPIKHGDYVHKKLMYTRFFHYIFTLFWLNIFE